MECWKSLLTWKTCKCGTRDVKDENRRHWCRRNILGWSGKFSHCVTCTGEEYRVMYSGRDVIRKGVAFIVKGARRPAIKEL
jgi:hypothetical protein